MKLSITATDMDIRPQAPIVFRGSYQDTIKKIKEIGYDGVEAHIHDSADFDRAGFRQLLAENGLDLTSIGTGSAYGRERIFLASEDGTIRKRAIERLNGHVVTAGEYESCIVIIGLIKGRIADCSSPEVYHQNLVTALRECAAFSESHGVTLGIEVINRYESDYLNRISKGLRLLDEVGFDSLKLHIDTYHMNIEETDIGAAIKHGGGQIAHVHIADSDRWYAGHGHYDFKETMAALKAIDYKGSLAVESLNFPNAETSARSSLEFLRPLL